jgi:ribA/ribD-fused uncharacterized protein
MWNVLIIIPMKLYLSEIVYCKMSVLYFYGHTPNNNDKYKRYVFSQFYPCDFTDENNVRYWCCEQYMMSKKALLFASGNHKDYNVNIYNQILECKSAAEIKRYGRKVSGFDEKTWQENRVNIVTNGNYLKFTQNTELSNILIATGNMILAEASPYDNIWGIGLDRNTAEKGTQKDWKGLNLLGTALMYVRDQLTSAKAKQ